MRQLEALSSFFSLVRANAVSFISQQPESNISPKLHSEEELTKPIKVFIANFIQEILLGVPSYAMGRASCALLEAAIGSELNLEGVTPQNCPDHLLEKTQNTLMSLFSEETVKIGTAIIHNYDFNWRKGDMTRRLDEALGMLPNVLFNFKHLFLTMEIRQMAYVAELHSE